MPLLCYRPRLAFTDNNEQLIFLGQWSLPAPKAFGEERLEANDSYQTQFNAW